MAVLPASPGQLKELAQYTTRRRPTSPTGGGSKTPVPAGVQRSYVSMNAIGRLSLNSRRKMSVRA